MSTEPDANGGSIETPARPAGHAGEAETKEANTVRVLLERLAARGPEPSLRHTTATYQFDLENAGRWYVRLISGAAQLTDATTSPDCVVSATAADFLEIAEGNRNLITAFLQGRVGISGDLALAIAFRRLLPVTS
jgi:predicted lipid carrier protein YhbT